MTHDYCMTYMFCTCFNLEDGITTRYNLVDLKNGTLRYVEIRDDTGEIISSIVANITEIKDRFGNILKRENNEWLGPYIRPQDIADINHEPLPTPLDNAKLTGVCMRGDQHVPTETFLRALGI